MTVFLLLDALLLDALLLDSAWSPVDGLAFGWLSDSQS
jgi:hypothetical protein